MTSDALKLTCWLGEREREGGRFLADALGELFAQHAVRTSCVVRGVEGFGDRQRLESAHLLTLSEDLPLAAVAVDEPARVERLFGAVTALRHSGVVTLERTRLLDGALPPRQALAAAGADGDAVQATLFLGRRQRGAAGSAHRAVVDALHAAGADGAIALLGVDGTVRGEHARARFFSRNAAVPTMVVGVGAPAAVADALERVAHALPQPLATLERVQVCKRDGTLRARPRAAPEHDASGLPVWQKLTVLAPEDARHDGEPLHEAAVRRLRAAGAAGATTCRGLWGFDGERPPHGDRALALRRTAPLMTVAIDRPRAAQRWFDVLDELTGADALVTSELVPALHGGAHPPRAFPPLAQPDG